jgi:hypothetical protein
VFVGSPRLGRSSCARNRHVLDTEVGELPVDLGLAVAAVGGDDAQRDDSPESVALSPA